MASLFDQFVNRVKSLPQQVAAIPTLFKQATSPKIPMPAAPRNIPEVRSVAPRINLSVTPKIPMPSAKPVVAPNPNREIVQKAVQNVTNFAAPRQDILQTFASPFKRTNYFQGATLPNVGEKIVNTAKDVLWRTLPEQNLLKEGDKIINKNQNKISWCLC